MLHSCCITAEARGGQTCPTAATRRPHSLPRMRGPTPATASSFSVATARTSALSLAPITSASRAARQRRRGDRLHVAAANYEAPTIEDLKVVAKARGVELKLETFGPSFKIFCTAINADPEDPPLGVLEGFIAPPFKLLHLDSIRIYNSRIRGAGRSKTQTPFGLSLLIGGAAFLYARDQGCTKAELLAIDDDNGYAPRLVGYYKRLGFVPVRKVEGVALADVPHMIVWGGVGTRMDANIPELVEKWARAVLSRAAPEDAE